ncbi:tropomodulin isoform X2 [Ixodes scapularis]
MSIISVKTTTHRVTTRVTTHHRVSNTSLDDKPALHMAENMVKDLKKYADMDIDELLGKLSEEELEQLGNMVDPDCEISLDDTDNLLRERSSGDDGAEVTSADES